MEKSYVSMGLCPICKEENGTILMDRRLKDSLDRHTPTLDPCDKCKQEILDKCVLLFIKESEHSKQIMGHFVIPDEIFKHFINPELPKEKIAFCDLGTAQAVNTLINKMRAQAGIKS